MYAFDAALQTVLGTFCCVCVHGTPHNNVEASNDPPIARDTYDAGSLLYIRPPPPAYICASTAIYNGTFYVMPV